MLEESTAVEVSTNEKQEKNAPLDSWYKAYKEGDRLFPQTTPAINIFVGQAVLHSIKDGNATWSDFVNSDFSSTQMDEEVRAVIERHRAFGIKKIPEGFTQEGEDPFSIDNLKLAYNGTKHNIGTALYNLIEGTSLKRSELSEAESSQVIESYLVDADNLNKVLSLFTAGAEALRKSPTGSVSARYKAGINYKRLGTTSQPVTKEQRAPIRENLDKIIAEPLKAAGLTKGFSSEQVDTFIHDVKKMDIVPPKANE